MIIKKCFKCNSLIKVINDCKCNNCSINCCGEEMKTIKPNTTDASIEKHVPEYEIVNNEIKVKVNHVMEEDHYIEWISYVYDNFEQTIYFKPNEIPMATFEYIKGATIYSYCNKHNLWSKEVE